jgi:hypothetical protein
LFTVGAALKIAQTQFARQVFARQMGSAVMSNSAHSGSITRRSLIEAGCSTALGLGLSSLLGGRSQAEVAAPRRAKSVLFLFLFGGPSHLDTFDPKPGAPDECRGEFRPIDTSVRGVQICEHLPNLAQRMHHWALIRSMTCNPSFGDHRSAVQGMLAGVDELPPGAGLAARDTTGRPGARVSNTFDARSVASLPALSCPAK